MDEKLKNTIISAVQEAGIRLGNPDPKKTAYELERRCREQIVRQIKKTDPLISLWGEEEREPQRALAICPLDSADNFARGIGPFGVMAAYIQEGTPVFGALFLPMTVEMVVAERGKGARMNGKRFSVCGRADMSRALVCCSLGVYGEDNLPIGLDIVPRLAESAVSWRNLGSPALEFVSLAGGMIDGLIIPAQESAHATGYLIMQEAGAKVTDSHGKPFSLYSQNIIAANPGLHGPLLELVQGALG